MPGERLQGIAISIHALRGEGDLVLIRRSPVGTEFLSTPSVGRATIDGVIVRAGSDISIHALRGEGDAEFDKYFKRENISIHALRGEGDCR